MSVQRRGRLLVLICALAACDGGPREGLDGDVGLSSVQIGPAGGTFRLMNQRVTLEVPAGALSSEVLITVRKSTNHPAAVLLVDHTAYELLPVGAVFKQAVTLSIGYEETALPSGTNAAGLTMHVVAGGDWLKLQTGGVKAKEQVVWARIKGTGTYGIMAHASSGVDGAVGDGVSDGGVADAADGPAPQDVGMSDLGDGAGPDAPLDAAADAPVADLPGSDGPLPDASKPDAPSLDAPIPDAPAPDVAQPDAAQPDLKKPDSAAPDLLQPDALVPDGATSPPTTACLSGDGTCPFGCTPSQDSDCAPVSLAAGYEHSCYVSASGAVLCWGDNGKVGSHGVLGIGSKGGKWAKPLPTLMKSGFKAAALGRGYTCGLTKAGALWCGGEKPALMPGLTSGIKAVSANESYRCALTQAGGVLCWGENTHGQLGVDDFQKRTAPTQVKGLASGVTAIATGKRHACALHAGVVKCWGDNYHGQLGAPLSKSKALVPVVAVGIGSGVTALAAGNDYTCAIQGGVGKCWGDGQRLGTGATTKSTNVAAAVKGSLSGVKLTSIRSWERHTCAVTTAKQLHCWGQNIWGQLGDGTMTERHTPKLILTGVDEVAVGHTHTCARSGAQIRCWGNNIDGRLGNGKLAFEMSPRIPPAATGLSQVGLGLYHGCGITSAGGVTCWGANGQGQLGTGDTTWSLTPRNVVGLSSSATKLVVGSAHACAVHAGKVKCWGGGTKTAVEIKGFTGPPTRMATFGKRTCVVSGGAAYCWSTGYTTAYKEANAASDIAVGAGHRCVVDTPLGQVLCSGGGSSGQLGNGQTFNTSTWQAAIGLYYSATYVWAGGNRSCAMRGGRLYCWGEGHLGHGTDAGSTKPVEAKLPAPPPGVSHAAMGEDHTCAIRAHALYCWGKNEHGQLGDGTQQARATPAVVPGMTSHVSAVSAGPNSTCAVHKGVVKCWGDNFHGQLGLGHDYRFATPQKVVWPQGELCLIDGLYRRKGEHAVGGCAVCDPTKSRTAWTVAANTCVVDSVCYKAGDVSPSKCGKCDPAKAPFAFVPRSGICKIDGVCLAMGAQHPAGCGECAPSVSTTKWSVKGNVCLIDDTCKAAGTMDSATCASCDPTKDKNGWSMSHCRINDACVADGKKTSTGCAECDVSASTTSWTVKGNACFHDGVCVAAGTQIPSLCSSCVPSKDKLGWTLAANHCVIGGACVTSGALHPGKCASCNPAVSTSSWTATGNTCLINDTCYKAGDKGPGGCTSCQPTKSRYAFSPLPGHCEIDGACYNSGDKLGSSGCGVCTPSASATSWTPSSGYCVIDNQCVSDGAKSSGGGAVCDTSKSKTSWTVPAGYCLIAGEYRKADAKEPGGCGVCDPTKSTSRWTRPKGCHVAFAWGKAWSYTSDLKDVAVDSRGNVYVAGHSKHSGKNEVYLTSYTPSGQLRWTRQSATPVGGWSYFGLRLGVDGKDNIYMVGTFTKAINFGGSTLTCAGPDLFLVSFDSSGKHRWSKRPAFGKVDGTPTMAVGRDGTVAIAGAFSNKIYFDKVWLQANGGKISITDIYLASFDATGKHVWSGRFGGPRYDHGIVAMDDAGNVYLAGQSEESIDFGGGTLNTKSAGFLASFTKAGKHRWSKSLGSGSNARSLAADPNGNLFFMATSQNAMTIGGQNVPAGSYLVSTTGTGSYRWSRGVNTWVTVAVGRNGDPHIFGKIKTPLSFGGGNLTPDKGAFLVGFTPGGLHRWSRGHKINVRAMAAQADGSVAVIATSYATDVGGGYWSHNKTILFKLAP